LVIEAIGLGLLVSLLFSEVLGLAAGVMVVPGYIALALGEPARVIGTIIVALATFLCARLLSNFVLIYGRRRIVVVVLIGFVLGALSRQLMVFTLPQLTIELQAVGFIIPGLIAIWMERQGVWKTLSTMIIAAVLVRLILIVVHGGDIFI
jgi:poly-gamma-glutamate biosynthesis protein PgsC/CapC